MLLRRYIAALLRYPATVLASLTVVFGLIGAYAIIQQPLKISVASESMRIANHPIAQAKYAYESAVLAARQRLQELQSETQVSSSAPDMKLSESFEHAISEQRFRDAASVETVPQGQLGFNSRSKGASNAISIIFTPKGNTSLSSTLALRELAQVEQVLRTTPGYEENAVDTARRSIVDFVFVNSSRPNIIQQQLVPTVSLQRAYFDMQRDGGNDFVFPLDYDPTESDRAPASLRSGFPFLPRKAAKKLLQGEIADRMMQAQSQTEHVQFYFGGNSLTQHLLRLIVRTDTQKALYGLALVAALMCLMFWSIWLPFAGCALILIGDILTYALLVFVTGLEELPVIVTITLYVSVAIGVDDVFALTLEIFQSREAASEHELVSVYHNVVSHAGMSVLATSLTTAVAFLSNIGSPLPAVRLYGVASAMVVCFHLLLCFTFYLAALLFYERNLRNQGVCEITCFTRTSGNRFSSPIARLLHRVGSRLANVVVRFPFIFLGSSVAIMIVGFTAFLVNTSIDKSMPLIFDEGVNAQSFMTLSREHYGTDGLSSSGLGNRAIDLPGSRSPPPPSSNGNDDADPAPPPDVLAPPRNGINPQPPSEEIDAPPSIPPPESPAFFNQTPPLEDAIPPEPLVRSTLRTCI